MNQQTVTGMVYLELLEQKLIDSQHPDIIMAYLNQIYASGYDFGRTDIRPHLKKPVEQLDMNGKKVNEFDSIKAAQRATGINKNTIRLVASGKRKSAGGYKWRLV